MRRAVACIACFCALAGARAAPAPRRRLAASSEENFAAESNAPAPQSPPAPRAPAAGAATHPLTVRPEFQLDGVSPAVQNQIKELVLRGLAALGEYVHLPGPPAPLLLPRTCLKVREWSRRDGSVTSECIEAAPASGSKCLSATHNASLFAPLSICHGERPGSCRVEAGGTPVLADLVLYVTSASGGVAACGVAAASSRAGGASAQLAAAGGACETDPKSGRPVAGAVNLCPGRVAALSSGGASAAWSADALLTDFLHEMMHVLAFSAGLYRFFPSEGAHIAPGPDNGLLVSSPAVLNIARQHFGCPSLQGVPLETQGGSGTAATHWRLRTLNGELMTGTIITGQRPRLSNFTLAFLQDTAWYVPQYGAAERLAWGAGAGCEFVTAASCAELPRNASSFFCTPSANSSAAVSCTSDSLAVGACSPLPLTRPDERCFGVASYSNWLCRDAALESADRAMWGYRFGPGSRCLPTGTKPWSRTDKSGSVLLTQESVVPGCFAMRCNASGALYVSIDDVLVACPQGQLVELSTVKGLRFRSGQLGPCPPAAQVCPACPNDCSTAGECTKDGKCMCWPGFEGPDCSTLAT